MAKSKSDAFACRAATPDAAVSVRGGVGDPTRHSQSSAPDRRRPQEQSIACKQARTMENTFS
jgi:hypothetical protein